VSALLETGGSLRRHAAAEALDRQLGDPRDPANPFGFEAAANRDRGHEYPERLARAARRAGLHLSYVPSHLGGTLDGYDRALMLARIAARRDPTVMPATMISISALTSLLAGSATGAAARAAEVIRSGGAVAYALSEEQAGSDPLASACTVTRRDGKLVLNGGKWMVGSGDRCEALYVLARSGGRGPGAFTALLLDRSQLPADRARALPCAAVDGMRGIGFASFEFSDCPVPEEAIAGEVGHGLEAAMKAQQVVRMMSAAGCLGAADTALRMTLDFAAQRRIGAHPLLDQPLARAELARAFAALAAADAVSIAAARAVHVSPERFSVFAAVVKRLAVQLCNASIAHASAVIGSRGLICEGPGGVFAKMRRDCAVIEYIDTSPVANLRGIAMQMPMLARTWARSAGDGGAAAETIFSMGGELPEPRPVALRLHASGRDDVLWELGARGPEILEALQDEPAIAHTRALLDDLRDLMAAAAAGDVRLADRICHLYGGACCLLVWWRNRGERLFGQDPGSEAWLTAALGYLRARAAGLAAPAPADVEPALQTALDLHRGERLMSIVPVALAAAVD
jgi:alkylation response protein AidB-like acyl-CoA dehydrogenase